MSTLHSGKTDLEAEPARHVEHGEADEKHGNNTLAHDGFVVDADELPRGYFRSKFFLGTFAALGMAICAGTASFAYAAPLLTIINADLGPSASTPWVSYVYNTAIAVTFPILGRLSDTFGRRYYFIGGAVLGLIGSIVSATAKDVPTLIGGNVLLGVASATQLSYHFVLGELVPTKYRYLAVAILYSFTLLGSGFAPALAYYMNDTYPAAGWRAMYYLLIGYEALALILWTAFYFPPTFQSKHGSDQKIGYWVKNFDYVGTILFAGGFVVFLFGISVGGNTYPWKSAPTIVMIVIGFLALVAFGLWEYIRKPQEAIAPAHVFTKIPWLANAVTVGFAASVFYTSAIIWPQQVFTLYPSSSIIQSALLASLPALGNVSGQCVGGPITLKMGSQKWQVIGAFFIAGTLTACGAVVDTHNKGTLATFVFLGNFFMGWVEIICLVNSTVILLDQADIGVAGGLAAGIRTGISAIGSVVYGTVLANQLTVNVPAVVGPAVVQAGLPAGSVASFLEALQTGTSAAFAKVPGVSAQIIATGVAADKVASVHSYRTVYLVSIAFSALGLFASFFTVDANKLVNNKIAATLGKGQKRGHE